MIDIENDILEFETLDIESTRELTKEEKKELILSASLVIAGVTGALINGDTISEQIEAGWTTTKTALSILAAANISLSVYFLKTLIADYKKILENIKYKSISNTELKQDIDLLDNSIVERVKK